MRMSSQNRLVPLLFVLGPHMCCLNHNVYKCIYKRSRCPSMNAGRRKMSKGTTNVPDSDRCGLPLLPQRPIEGRNDGEKTCFLSPMTKGKAGGLWGFSGFGPAPGSPPATTTERTWNQDGNVATGLTPPLVGTSPVTLRVIEAEHTDASQPVDGLTETDLVNLSAVLDHEVSRNTVTNYRAQWRSFMAWSQAKGIRGIPAEPKQVAAYLAERMGEYGHKPATPSDGCVRYSVRPQGGRNGRSMRQLGSEENPEKCDAQGRPVPEAG